MNCFHVQIISPASQEKLCKAMKSIELQDEDISKIHRSKYKACCAYRMLTIVQNSMIVQNSFHPF